MSRSPFIGLGHHPPQPTGISAEVETAARETLGGAVAVGGRMPEPLGAALIGAARDAFGQSFEVVAAVCASLLVALAIVAAVLLRREGSRAEAERQGQPVALPAR